MREQVLRWEPYDKYLDCDDSQNAKVIIEKWASENLVIECDSILKDE